MGTDIIGGDRHNRSGTRLKVEYIPQEKSIWSGGWAGGWVVLSGNNNTSWLHIASWNLPDSLLGRESKMEPSVAIMSYFLRAVLTL